MASSIAIRLQIEPLRELTFGGISGVYAGIGTALNNPAHMIIINNTTDVDLLVSDNGVDDKMYVPSKQGRVLDITSNKALGGGLYIAQGVRFYAKEASGGPSEGAIFLEVYYAAESV